MKAINGYEGIYVINELGEVFSLDRLITGVDGTLYPKKGKKLKQTINKQNGYLYVSLWKDNKGKNFSVHRLVATAFIDNLLNKLEVNHKDSDRLNCSVDNLEWVTSSENSIHGYTHGNASQKSRRNLIEQDYVEVYKRFMLGEPFSSILVDFNISPGRLSVNLKNLTKKWGTFDAYRLEVHRQQVARAKVNGSH